MRSALSLVLAGVIAVALGVTGTVALASTFAGPSAAEAAELIEGTSSDDNDGTGTGTGKGGGNAPLVYGTR